MRYLLPACLLLFLSLPSPAATRTLTGAGGDATWTTVANWVDNTPPAANDDLVFPAAAAQQSNNNNFFLFTSFHSITVEGGTYVIGGNPFRLTSGLNVGAGALTLNAALSLSGAQTFLTSTGATATIVVLSTSSQPLAL